jgi:RHS repeat-associated protein
MRRLRFVLAVMAVVAAVLGGGASGARTATTTTSVGNTGTIDSAYNSADQLTSTTKSGQSTNYTYDVNGNQAAIGARSFTYDLASRLGSTTNAGTTSTYSYDGDGRRISSTTGGGGADLRYVWDPRAESGIAEIALERTSAGSLVRRYLGGASGPISMTNASATFYYHRDPLNTVTDVTDASGVAQWKYEYEAFGAERTATNVSGSAPENRLRFNSQYLDPETIQYHLRARQYDPGTGRLGALDPVENSLMTPYDGAYVYVNGRPTALVDPLGLWGLATLGNAAAGAADYVSFGVTTRGLNAAGIRPDTNSTAFRVGQGVGFAATTLAGGYGAARGVIGLERALATGGLRAAAPGLIRAGVAGAANVAIGYGLSYFTCTPYSFENGLFDFGFGGLTGLGSFRSPAMRFAAEDETLYRFGTQRLTAEELDAQAKAAQRAGFPHGVSTSARPPVQPGAPNAPRSAVEQHFPVHDTPTRRNPLHRTVELPDPVTQADADLFHELFGFPR